jgi:probable HAF family extracellular repeat protein
MPRRRQINRSLERRGFRFKIAPHCGTAIGWMKLEAGGCAMSGTSLRSTIVALATLCALVASGPAAGQTYASFSLGKGLYTTASAINAAGTVVGSGCGDDFCNGFVRTPDGTITVFTVASSTAPTAIDRSGAIAGYDCDMAGPCHGFLRKPNGKITSFDPAGSTYTVVSAMNDSGVITGFWADANINIHGFVRAADGTITAFDPTGSVDTEANAVNANGDIVGFYADASGHTHGFLRVADGAITSFDVKGVANTSAYGINRKDAIVGSSDDTAGFERTPGGKFRTFEPGVSLSQASAINDSGEIAGFTTTDQAPYGYAYVGSPKAGFTSFNVPNGAQTQPSCINSSGVIAGAYYDTTDHQLDGFVRVP